jgi:translation elongation factor EF-Tu-like GTPase
MERKKVGEVFHFYGKIGVAAIRLTDGSLALGDTVQIQGPTSNLEQPVETLQIEHANVTRGEIGQEVGMKVRERVREKDFVYKLIESGAPAMEAPPKAAPAKAVRTKIARAKKARVKRAPVRKKASRAKRSKARRGSRGSRPRSR